MRVLFITDVCERYGATEALLQLISILSQRHGVEPVIATSVTGRIAEFAKKNGFECYTIGHHAFMLGESNTIVKKAVKRIFFPLLYLRYYVKSNLAMKNAEKNISFDSIDLIHTNLNRNDIGALLAEKYNIPHIWHIREFGDLDYPCISLKKDFISFMNAHTSVFPVISGAVAEHWVKKGIRKEKIRMVYDGVNEARFLPGKKTIERKGPLKVVFCGSVSETKGQLHMIEAIACLGWEERQQVHVDIYGSGTREYIAFLNRKIRDNGLVNTVHMCGYCDCLQTKLPDYEVGMMCSRSEGFGLVTVEYMMSGLCVIASDTGVNPELVPDGECGLLYRYGDVADLARKLRFALTHREEIQKMGENAREYACQNFTATRNADRIYEIYQELIAEKNASIEE